MQTRLLLLDVPPGPVSGPIIGMAGLILIVVLVLMVAAATITSFVFLLRRLTRKSRRAVSPTLRQGSG